jgi:hypothetical protein
MNSDDRRAARRARRDAERARKRETRNANCTLEDVADSNALYRAQREAARGVNWKTSTQRYRIDWLINNIRARQKILNGEEVCKGFHEFDIYERGKHRHIASVHFSERVIQKSLTQNAYVPTMTPSYVYDNAANMRGKGTSFAIKRVKQALARHYRKYGEEGYVLQADFKSFFASIPHERTKDFIEHYVTDPRVVALGKHFVDVQGDVGLGLGSEPNQILAVGFPDEIDHLIQDRCGVEFYGRYMDDLIVLVQDKLTAQVILALLRDAAARCGLTINEKKTHIVKLSHGFTYLKTQYTYTSTGKVIMRPSRDSITRERRKLKAHARMVREGLMTYEQALQSYQSWRGSKLRLNAHDQILKMDALFAELIGSRRKELCNGHQRGYGGTQARV